MGREGSGVTESGGKCRLSFTWQGKRCRETLDLAHTPSNIRAAERMLAGMRDQMRLGTFDYGATFPGSRQVKTGAVPAASGARGKSFGAAVQDFLDSKADKAKSTRTQYRNAGEFWKLQFGADTRLGDITPSKVKKAIAGHPWASGKLKNNYLVILRGACGLAASDDPSWPDPTAGLENAPKTQPKPDPLSRTQMLAVLEHMRVAFDARAHAYFVWQFATGMRPEESIELRWSDIDFKRESAHVCRARCAGEVKGTKTYEARDVDLGPEALEALRAMTVYTRRTGEPHAEVFQNPNTKRPWNDSRGQHVNFWLPALAACRIARRRAYQTRHTYATTRLMLGAVPAYIAAQLGHMTPEMVYKTYSRWISSDTTERDRVRALLAAQAAAPA